VRRRLAPDSWFVGGGLRLVAAFLDLLD